MIKILWKIYKIMRWHKKQFRNYTAEKQTEKIAEEILEWDREFFIGDSIEKELEELTDVIIASIGILRFKDVWVLIDDKMKKNKQRKWKNGHHITRK